MKKIGIIILSLYGFSLLQMSFFVHVLPAGFIPNLILLFVVMVTLFEKPESYASFSAALFGGVLLDIFSGGFIGFWSVLLLAFSLLVKMVLQNYVRFSIPQKF
jgi:rod shape-determining protein MreD